jgi:hypothetical protein
MVLDTHRLLLHISNVTVSCKNLFLLELAEIPFQELEPQPYDLTEVRGSKEHQLGILILQTSCADMG